MRHHPEYVAALVDDAGDVVKRSVRVRARNHAAVRIAVAKHDLSVLLQAREHGGVGEVAALSVRDGRADNLAVFALRGERQVGALNHEVGPFASELERSVASQCSGQQAGFAQDLKTVADPPHEPTAICELSDLFHYGREARDRAGAKVVAVGKAAGQDDAVAAFEVCVLVPQILKLRAHDLVDHPAAIAVRPRAREYHDPKLHRRCLPSCSISTWKSSMT